MINITNPDVDPVAGDLVKTVSAGGTVVTFNYIPPPSEDEQAAMDARQWRDNELAFLDKAAQTPDWPNRANILLYRSELRSWPADADNFPTTPPVLETD